MFFLSRLNPAFTPCGQFDGYTLVASTPISRTDPSLVVSVHNPYAPVLGASNLPILLTVTHSGSGVLQAQIQLQGVDGSALLSRATGIAASNSYVFVAAGDRVFSFPASSVRQAVGAAFLAAESSSVVGSGLAAGGLSVFMPSGGGCVLKAASADGVIRSMDLSGCGAISGAGWRTVLNLGLEAVVGYADMGTVGAGGSLYVAVLQCRNDDHFR